MLQHVSHVKPLLAVFWSLCYEAAFYVLVAATLLAAVACRRVLLVLDLCHALTILCSLALIAVPNHIPFPLDLWPQFGLGAIVLDMMLVRRPAGIYVLFSTFLLQGIYAFEHLTG